MRCRFGVSDARSFGLVRWRRRPSTDTGIPRGDKHKPPTDMPIATVASEYTAELEQRIGRVIKNAQQGITFGR